MRRLFHLGVLLCVPLAGCGTATVPCGQFTFTGAPDGGSGINLTQSFQFGPAPCATACTTNTIAYVQIMRAHDMDTGEDLQPSAEQSARMITGDSRPAFNGWAVDRIDNRIWGYYGRNNDGAFSGTLTPGSNASPAVLLDHPSGWPAHSWFDAIDVPVCIDAGSSCVNKELGFDYWLFFIDPSGVAGAPFEEIARTWHADVAELAIARWNATAPGVGKNTFPAFTRMN